MFDPHEYIEVMEDGYALCTNPSPDAGLNAIRVNTNLAGDALRSFEQSVKRMVLQKLFSPKFGEIILTATQMRLPATEAPAMQHLHH